MGVKKKTVDQWQMGDVIGYDLNDEGEVTSLFCKVCREVYGNCSRKGLKGTVAAQVDKWVVGTSTVKKCNALEHITKSNCHRAAALRKRSSQSDAVFQSTPGQQTIPETVRRITASQREQLLKKMQLAHFIALNNYPFQQYANFAKFEKEFHGVDLGSAYLCDKSCREMISILAEYIRREVTEPLNNGQKNYFTIFYDGSSSAKTMDEKELYVIKTSSSGKASFQVLSLEEPEDASATGLKAALDCSIKKQDFKFPREQKQVGNCSDGASVNSVLFRLEKEELGEHLLKGWCANHKSELGITDSFKHIELNTQVEEDLSNAYYFFKKANLKWRLFKQQASFMNLTFLKFKRPNGTRWVSHQVLSSENYIRNLPVFIAFCNEQLSSPYNKTMKDAAPRLKGYLKNAVKLDRIIFIAARKDLLSYLSPFSKCWEKQSLLMPEAITSMKAAIATTERLFDLVKDKGTAALYLDNYFPCLAKFVWPYLQKDDPNQFVAERRQRDETSNWTKEDELSDHPLGYHGYSVSGTLDRVLPVVLTAVQTGLENLTNNLKARFSEYLDNPLYLAIATVLDTKTYQHKTSSDIMTAVHEISSHFKMQLEGNGCNLSRLQTEFDIVHVHVTTFLKSVDPVTVWPQLFQTSTELCIANFLHIAEIGIVAPISSAEIERVFSQFSKIVTKGRQSLKNKTIEDLLIIKSSGRGMLSTDSTLYNNAISHFLSKYPDGSLRKRSRRPDGYPSTCTKRRMKEVDMKQSCLFLSRDDETETSDDIDLDTLERDSHTDSSSSSDSDSDFE